MKTYRIAVEMHEIGYCEVEAENATEAIQKVTDDTSDFVGHDSWASVGQVIESR